MTEVKYLTVDELEKGLDYIRESPKNNGVIEMIVCRPERNQRIVMTEGIIDPDEGLVGDNWRSRSMEKDSIREDHLDRQITLMNSRSAALLAVNKERWALAGDQLYIDMDLGKENLPSGTKLHIGTVILEVTDKPHTGCDKFRDRYGMEAVRFVNSNEGKLLNLRGINTRVIRGGVIKVGDAVKKTH